MLAGCAPKPDSSSVPEAGSAVSEPGAETADTQPAPSAVDPLTGAARDSACTRRPYAVTFYNSPAALPQWGISSAQVLIECLTEGNTTYQMGLDHLDRLLHLYYGPAIGQGDLTAMYPPADRGFSPNHNADRARRGISPDTLPQEYTGCNTGIFGWTGYSL